MFLISVRKGTAIETNMEILLYIGEVSTPIGCHRNEAVHTVHRLTCSTQGTLVHPPEKKGTVDIEIDTEVSI